MKNPQDNKKKCARLPSPAFLSILSDMEAGPPPDFFEFWAIIKAAASEVQQRRNTGGAVSALGLTGGGAALGTAIFPGVGTVIGGGVGLLSSLFAVSAVTDLPKNLVFSQVLQMTDTVGLEYAELLFKHYRGFLSYESLVNNIMPANWNDHIDRLQNKVF